MKKTPIQDYANVRKTGLAAIVLREDDKLIEVKITDNTEDIFLVTKYGMCIRFNETDVRSTGRVSMGVRGMNLTDNDVVIGMQIASQGKDMLIVSERGMGKGWWKCGNHFRRLGSGNVLFEPSVCRIHPGTGKHLYLLGKRRQPGTL